MGDMITAKYEYMQQAESLEQVKRILQSELQNLAEGYITVGYLLKKTRDNELYKEEGYADVFEFAEKTFGVSRTWAIRFMQINDTYSIDGNSVEIQERYRGYGSSKLAEMLTLPMGIRDEVPPSATVGEIREVKRTIRETEDEYDPQMRLCDVAQNGENTKSEADFEGEENWMKKLAFEFFKKDGRNCFLQMSKWLESDEESTEAGINREIMEIVAPTKFRMVRLATANVLFSEKGLRVMPYAGHGEQEEFKYTDFGKAFEGLFYPEELETSISPEEAFEMLYGEPLKPAQKQEQKPANQKQKPESQKQNDGKPDRKTNKEDKTPVVPKETQQGQQGAKEPENDADKEDLPLAAGQEKSEAPAGNPKNGHQEAHIQEITEDIVQEGEAIKDILRSGNLSKIQTVIEREFEEPAIGWVAWLEKVVKP